MAIIGRFHPRSGALFVDATVSLPAGSELQVQFLIDTGADRTALAARDAGKLGIDYSRLPPSSFEALGVGGIIGISEVDATLVFRDEAGVRIGYQLKLLVLPPIPEYGEAPSLLGRDIIRRGRLICDERARLLRLDMHDRDFG